MQIRVSDFLDLLASGLDASQILAEMPGLEAEDLKDCMRFASRRVDHAVLAVRRSGWTPIYRLGWLGG
jgi:uncharacterized protein (DUF433 family)